MPTYAEALAADPSGFVDYAAEMTSAGTDLTDHRAEYDDLVAAINTGWRDRANTAFNDDVATVDAHVDEVVSQVDQAAELLGTGGGQMASQVEQLQAADAAYRGAGFNVQAEPRVELGAVHWAAIAAAGPFGPVLQAVYQARADEGTRRLRLGLAMLTATDAITGAALTAAAQELKPLEDKGGPDNTICPPVVGEDDGPGRDEPGRKGEDESGEKTAEDRDGKGEKDEDDDKSGKDDDGDGDRTEDDREQRDDRPDPEQRTEAPQPDADRPEGQVPGMEQPDLAAPEVPDYQGPDLAAPEVPDYQGPDLAAPEIPEYESTWDPGELGDAEPMSGGLAAGGGIGGGLPSGGAGAADLPSGGSGTAPGGVFASTAAGGAPAAGTGSGARPGAGGFMGAPGARGAAVPDDEVERESFLVEDPEEDVWGIGTAEGNPYVDYQEEQSAQSELPPLPPVEEIPPFTLPGFDLPADKP
ncbi:hypothetical protein LO763_24130 [Glycomyces sp. A-F 0318]|uniref:WXG100 family type VII secretion target n=1 Tax=Glycomyces amatae TaxID=2881355 RepID=UPI001E4AFD8E|nr:hypothetical protein [Glycomyces amatae]MCD0446711.1 hypothetical protein [Glycomyces amatae]